MLMKEAGYMQLVQWKVLVEKYLSACVLIYISFMGLDRRRMTKCQHSYFACPELSITMHDSFVASM